MNEAREAVDDGEPLLIGCDIGTSAVKTILATAGGEVLARSVAEHPMYHPQPGWAENDPEDWYRGVVSTIRAVIDESEVPGARIAGLGIVAQREPIVLLDSRGQSLAPSISWTDQRTSAEASEVSDRFGRSWLIERTGMVPLRGSSLTHLLWLRRHRPEQWRAARRIVFAKDYVLNRLTGVFETDASTPGRSLMLDIKSCEYSHEICEAFGIDLDLLPPIARVCCEPVAELTREAAGALGLPADTCVAMGGADDAAAALGGGAVAPGEMCVGTGTATDWRTVLDRPRSDPEGHGDVAPHVVPGGYIFEVAIESTGSSLRWLHEAFAPERSIGEMISAAARIEPGAGGLLFFPYVDGADRAPRYRAGMTGSFLGIVSGHTFDHMTRALLEGVAYQYPPTMAIVGARTSLRLPLVTGDGEARSDVWSQIKADVIGAPLVVPKIAELAASGAAILAGVAGGVFADVPTGAAALVRAAKTFEPDPARHADYSRLRTAYERVFEQISPASDNKERHDDNQHG